MLRSHECENPVWRVLFLLVTAVTHVTMHLAEQPVQSETSGFCQSRLQMGHLTPVSSLEIVNCHSQSHNITYMITS